MKRNHFLISISILLILMFFSCGQNHSSVQHAKIAHRKTIVENKPTNDSIVVMLAFDALKKDKKFLKDLALEGEKQYSFNDLILKPIFGDLNNDGVTDALVAFSVEGRSGGNNWDLHYAIFLNKNEEWEYQSQLDAGGNWAERFIEFDKIENGKITGNLVGNKDENLPKIQVEYVFKNEKLINTFTALYKGENTEREFLSVNEVITPNNIAIPIRATLKEYQTWLGKGKIIQPKEQPECGTFFDEGMYNELQYANLIIELSGNKKAACKSIVIKGSSFRVNTEKGTLSEKTTLNELENIFYKRDSWQINDNGDGNKTFIIPDGEESDNQLHILFDKSGRLIRLVFFVPC